MRVSANDFSDSWRCSITAEIRSWPSAKMSASTSTTSPTARLAGKRPSSTEGVTPSMTTRRRPSNCNSGTRGHGAKAVPGPESQQLAHERPRGDAEDAAGGTAAKDGQTIELFGGEDRCPDRRNERAGVDR